MTRARKTKTSPKPAPSAAARARAAKQKLVASIGAAAWCKGVGIAPGAEGGLALRLNVGPNAPPTSALPDEVDGLAVQVVRLAGYAKRAPARKAARKRSQ